MLIVEALDLGRDLKVLVHLLHLREDRRAYLRQRPADAVPLLKFSHEAESALAKQVTRIEQAVEARVSRRALTTVGFASRRCRGIRRRIHRRIRWHGALRCRRSIRGVSIRGVSDVAIDVLADGYWSTDKERFGQQDGRLLCCYCVEGHHGLLQLSHWLKLDSYDRAAEAKKLAEVLLRGGRPEIADFNAVYAMDNHSSGPRARRPRGR